MFSSDVIAEIVTIILTENSYKGFCNKYDYLSKTYNERKKK